jgi:hypothetical protein
LWRYGVIIFFVDSSNSPTMLMVNAPRKWNGLSIVITMFVTIDKRQGSKGWVHEPVILGMQGHGF